MHIRILPLINPLMIRPDAKDSSDWRWIPEMEAGNEGTSLVTEADSTGLLGVQTLLLQWHLFGVDCMLGEKALKRELLIREEQDIYCSFSISWIDVSLDLNQFLGIYSATCSCYYRE